MGYFSDLYFRDGKLTRCYFSFPTAMAYLHFKARYGGEFKKAPPRWLRMNITMGKRVDILREAVENRKPLSDKYPKIIDTPNAYPVFPNHSK